MTVSRTTLITGASSGLGLEAARQLLSRKGERVVISARSTAKANAAIERLLQTTGAQRDRVDAIIADFTLPDTVEQALTALRQRQMAFDGVILNAGGVAKLEQGTFPRTAGGLTTLFAMNVAGHAQLVHGMLDAGLLKSGAALVFAGSEASRGIPAMSLKTPTLPDLPGSLEEVVAGVARGDHLGSKVDVLTEYGLVKLIGNAWMRHLAQTHGDQLRAYAISPGASAGTAGTRSMPPMMAFLMRYVMFPMFRLMGSAHGVGTGAARYLQGLDDQRLENGAFYASPYPSLSGPLVVQDPDQQPLLVDDAFTAAVARYLDGLVGELRAAA